jgi:hypothetical protein
MFNTNRTEGLLHLKSTRKVSCSSNVGNAHGREVKRFQYLVTEGVVSQKTRLLTAE